MCIRFWSPPPLCLGFRKKQDTSQEDIRKFCIRFWSPPPLFLGFRKKQDTSMEDIRKSFAQGDLCPKPRARYRSKSFPPLNWSGSTGPRNLRYTGLSNLVHGCVCALLRMLKFMHEDVEECGHSFAVTKSVPKNHTLSLFLTCRGMTGFLAIIALMRSLSAR